MSFEEYLNELIDARPRRKTTKSSDKFDVGSLSPREFEDLKTSIFSIGDGIYNDDIFKILDKLGSKGKADVKVLKDILKLYRKLNITKSI